VTAPALYECTIRHVRAAPLANAFSYRSNFWLVDLDEVPWPTPLAAFLASDHLGDPQRSIRQNVAAFLDRNEVDVGAGQITMLANARVLGYAFNPLTVYWCHYPDGTMACVLAEVHNTYGQRHCYLLRTDDRGRATAAKKFYVSPFNRVEGSYLMSMPEPGQRLALTVTLHNPQGPPFVASVRGVRQRASAHPVLRAALRHPSPALAATARIHAQGVKLYARGLRVIPRPAHHPQEGVQ
jgi:uncharacterized protein